MNRVSIGFQKFAPMVVNNLEHVNDTNFRTAISRLYYSVFLELREIYKRKLPIDSLYRNALIKESPKVHALVKQATFFLKKSAGEHLEALHEYRKLSDYEIVRNVNETLYEEALKLHEKLIDFIAHVRSLHPDRVEKAFEKAYRKIIS